MTMGMGSHIFASIFSFLLVSICDGQAVRDNNTDGCSLLVDGQISQALMLTQVGVSSDILVDGAGCAVTLLLAVTVGMAGRAPATSSTTPPSRSLLARC